jgi:folylpolyglutamate synthase/dihydropteroate synthase
MDSDILATYSQEQVKKPVLSEVDSGIALKKAVEIAGPEGVVAVAGSLYLIGDIRECWH